MLPVARPPVQPVAMRPPSVPAADDSGGDKLSREPFRWPTPPYASYPLATPQIDPLPCEVVGLTTSAPTAD